MKDSMHTDTHAHHMELLVHILRGYLRLSLAHIGISLYIYTHNRSPSPTHTHTDTEHQRSHIPGRHSRVREGSMSVRETFSQRRAPLGLAFETVGRRQNGKNRAPDR